MRRPPLDRADQTPGDIPSNEVLIVETALHSLLVSVPQIAAIWFTMLAAVVVAAVILAVPGRPRRADAAVTAGRDAAPPGSLRSARTRRDPTAVDDRDGTQRYADEVAVAADRAAVTAQRARAAWERSVDAVEQAWQAFDEADRAARRAAQVMPFATTPSWPTSSELADRERYLHRAATAACRRGELSVSELNDVLAHRNGWDPGRHPVEQEALLRRAVRDRRFMAYREATTSERRAWHAAGVASTAMCSLRDEARVAALRAGVADRTEGELWWAGQGTTEPVATTQPVLAAQPVAPAQPAVAVGFTVAADDIESTQPLRIPQQPRVSRRPEPVWLAEPCEHAEPLRHPAVA
jgi:hypothetical protein